MWFFFVNDTAATAISPYVHTLSLHDALPILADAEHEDFAVPDATGVGGVLDGLHHLPDGIVGDRNLDFHLGKKAHRVFRSAVDLGLAFLAAVALHFADRQALDPNTREDRKSTRLNSRH